MHAATVKIRMQTAPSPRKAPALHLSPLATPGLLPIPVNFVFLRMPEQWNLPAVTFGTAFFSEPLLIEAAIHPWGHLYYFITYSFCAGLGEWKHCLKEN